MNELVPYEQVETEIAAIERDLRFDRQSYNRDVAKQDRYRQLLEMRDGQSVAATTNDAVVPIASQAEFQREHGTLEGYQTYMAASRFAADILTQMGPGEARSLSSSFEALPDSITDPVLFEMFTRAPARDLITNADVSLFASTPAGGAMVREWGHEAHDRLGTLRARWVRMRDGMDEGDWDSFEYWIDGLPDAAAKAIYRRMSQ